MVIRCLITPAVTTAARYALEHILRQAGFFFSWHETYHRRLKGLWLVYDQQPATIDQQFFLPACGFLNNPQFQISAWQRAKIDSRSIPVFYCTNKKVLDIPANIFYHLTRLEEQRYSHPDELENAWQKSVLYRYGNLKTPVVDLLVEKVKKEILLKSKQLNIPLMRIAPFPGDQAFGLTLTHDVDRLHAFHPLKRWVMVLSGRDKMAIERQEKRLWSFDHLDRLYAQKGWKGTFYFLARYSEGIHFRYRVQNRDVKQLIRHLRNQGHEVGLHPSRYCFEHPARYASELRKLEKILGEKTAGWRHHYLRQLFPEMWRLTQKLGLIYDATMIYNQKGGYRSGTAYPYPVFDVRQNHPLPVYEVPTLFFEKSLPDGVADTPDNRSWIEEMIANFRRWGGVLSALWHSNNVLVKLDQTEPFFAWLMERFAKENVFQSTVKEQVEWFKARASLSLQQGPSDRWLLGLQEVHRQITLHCPGDCTAWEWLAPPGVKLTRRGDKITVVNPGGENLEINIRPQ